MKTLFSKTAIMLFLMLLTTVQTALAWTENVSYIDENGVPQTVTANVLYSPRDYTLGTNGSTTWYIVSNGGITYSNLMVTIQGDVRLILRDGTTMAVTVERSPAFRLNGNLTIYGQSKGSGKLIAHSVSGDAICTTSDKSLTINGGDISISSDSGYGIVLDGGDFTVNGGSVSVTANQWHSAVTCPDATINGGTVNLTDASVGFDCQRVTINGGSVTAIGSKIGICAQDYVTINGGTVNATGTNGEGIYGFRGVTINGGYVNATSDNYGICGYGAITLGWTNKTDRITASSYYVKDGGTFCVKDGQALYDGTNLYSGTVSDFSAIAGKTLSPAYNISLQNNASNDAAITADYLNGVPQFVTLSGRTLYKDGKWNTICLPFDVTLSGSPLEGATARTLTGASIEESTLNLTFGGVVTDKLVAGTPYIIKCASGDNIVEPVFTGVTVTTSKHDFDNGESGNQRVRFIGTYNAKTFENGDNSILIIGGGNTLYYPNAGAGIGAQRAYFKIGDDDALLARQLTAFSINFGDEVTTGIISIENGQLTIDNSWYTVDGRRLAHKPAQRGMYINGGKKVIVK